MDGGQADIGPLRGTCSFGLFQITSFRSVTSISLSGFVPALQFLVFTHLYLRSAVIKYGDFLDVSISFIRKLKA